MSHIELIAGVGAGKSALAKCLKEHGFTHVPEIFETNPYLEKFQKNPFSCAPEFGMEMLKLHADRINTVAKDGEKQVFDFSMVTNEAYARTWKQFGMFMLKRKEGAAYMQACRDVRETTKKPALRIYLKLSAETQKERILKRGRELEKGTPKLFLSTLKKNLEKVMDTVDDGVPLLVIDAEKYDWVNSAEDKKEVVRIIREALETTQKPQPSAKQRPQAPKP